MEDSVHNVKRLMAAQIIFELFAAHQIAQLELLKAQVESSLTILKLHKE